jgi:hypothetical protein
MKLVLPICRKARFAGRVAKTWHDLAVVRECWDWSRHGPMECDVRCRAKEVKRRMLFIRLEQEGDWVFVKREPSCEADDGECDIWQVGMRGETNIVEHEDGDAIKDYIVGHCHFSEVDGAKIPKWYLQRSRLASMHLVRAIHDVLEQGWRQAGKPPRCKVSAYRHSKLKRANFCTQVSRCSRAEKPDVAHLLLKQYWCFGRCSIRPNRVCVG